MKWCIFVNRRCCGEDCVGWIKDHCFIYLMLPMVYGDEQRQGEFNWSKYESSTIAGHDSLENGDHQLSFLSELEKLIIQKNTDYKNN
jgi:hypothetical protein